MITIGERVRHLRQLKGLSMDKLAKQIKIPIRDNSENFKSITSAAISNIENDKGSPSAEVTIALSDFFNVSTDWILKGKEFEERPESKKSLKYLNIMEHLLQEEVKEQSMAYSDSNQYEDPIIQTKEDEIRSVAKNVTHDEMVEVISFLSEQLREQQRAIKVIFAELKKDSSE